MLQAQPLECDESWLARADAFPISLSLPLSPATTRDAHAFFANLLPEGNVRRRLCQRLQLSEDNDIALLRAIGGDCAGALCIAHAPQDADADAYQQIAPSTLAGWARGKPTALDAVSGSARIRLSLAGAQDKLPVRVVDDGIWLPLDGAASTHLLKFGSPDFRHLPANETLTTLLARQLGLPVVDIALRSADTAWFAVVERHDRFIDADGIVRRTHQEDACQALGLPAARKYEHEGGPRLVDIAELLRRHTPVPALAIEALVRWSAFNVLAGNADAHGKNLSLLIEPGSDLVTVAPFYDLVCTRCYEQLDRNMAMSIGDEVRPGEIAGRHWMALGGQPLAALGGAGRRRADRSRQGGPRASVVDLSRPLRRLGGALARPPRRAQAVAPQQGPPHTLKECVGRPDSVATVAALITGSVLPDPGPI